MGDGPPIVFLSIEQVLILQEAQLERYSGQEGVHKWDLLESAVAMPQQGFGGEYVHAFPFEMAAAYLYHLARNHAFHDGNKRVGAQAGIVFLRLNGYELEADPDELTNLTLAVVAGERDKLDVAAWFEQRVVRL